MSFQKFSGVSYVLGTIICLLLPCAAMAGDPPPVGSSVGVSPTGSEPIQFSLDEDNIGIPTGVTLVDADDLSTAGIDGMGYIYQTFGAAGGIGSPPAGYHSAVLNPVDLGLRRNVSQPFSTPGGVAIPLQTHKDEVNALSYGNDFFYTDIDPRGNVDTNGTPY